jgi:beta-phosphoglucomutase
MGARAIVFDFNGTLSDDEAILCSIFRTLFAERGHPLTESEYYERLAGLSDPEIVSTWLGAGHPAIAEVLAARVARYRAAVADGSSVPSHVRDAVREAARRVPVAVVSGAARAEIEPVIAAAGLRASIRAIVSSEDVPHGKPHPEGYLRALSLLDGGIAASDTVVFEDTAPGVASAKAAGMRCVAVLGTVGCERLGEADEIAGRLDAALVRRVLGV